MKVAIIEDDFIIKMFLENIISKTSCEIVGTAVNFESAIDLIENTKPDFVILDIGLNGKKNGIDTAEVINKRYSIPHIFISGNSDESTYQRAKDTNPFDFIKKPIDEYLLTEILVEICEKIKTNSIKI